MAPQSLSASERIDLAAQESEMARQNEDLARKTAHADRRRVYQMYGRRHRSKAGVLLRSVCWNHMEL